MLKDEAGVWVKGFARQIGCTTNFLAELWALRDGFIMCSELHINDLEINLDAKVIADLMSSSGSRIVSNSSIVANCRLLISRFPQVKVKHCYRESNSCADALARLDPTTKDISAEGSVIRMLEPVAKTASLMTRTPTTIPETISPVIGLLASVTKTTISASLVIRKLRSIAKTASLATKPPTSIACRKALATGLTT